MTISVRFRPFNTKFKGGKYDWFGVLKYSMFPEMEKNPDTGMEGEFLKKDYPEN
jgi:hypothetical protein